MNKEEAEKLVDECTGHALNLGEMKYADCVSLPQWEDKKDAFRRSRQALLDALMGQGEAERARKGE